MGDANLGIKFTARDEGSVVIERVAKSLKSVSVSAKQMQADMAVAGNRVAQIGNQIALAFGVGVGGGAAYALTNMAKSFVAAASEAQGYETRLRVLLGSQAQANKLFADMATYAARTPFELRNVMAAATQLAGVLKGGVAEVNQWIPLIGDLAAASGLTIEEATGQVSRMLSAGAASADLFRERGVLAMLGFQAGATYSTEETRTRLLAAWSDVGSKFRGATEQMAQDWAGKTSNIGDAWFDLKRRIGDSVIRNESMLTFLDLVASKIKSIDADKLTSMFLPGGQSKSLQLRHMAEILEKEQRYYEKNQQMSENYPGSESSKYYKGRAEESRNRWERYYYRYLELQGGVPPGDAAALQRAAAATRVSFPAAPQPASATDRERETTQGPFHSAQPREWSMSRADQEQRAGWLASVAVATGRGPIKGQASPEAVAMYWDEQAAGQTEKEVIAWWETMAREADAAGKTPSTVGGRSPEAVAMYWDEQAAQATIKDTASYWAELAKLAEDADRQAEESAKRRTRLYNTMGDALVSNLRSSAQTMLSLYEQSAGHGKKHWEWYKTLSAAEITASSATAIVKTWAGFAGYGWVGTAAAIAQSAVIVASAATQLSAVQSAQPKAFAAGGIVNRPTYGLLGEAGPEAVLPLNRLGDVASSGPKTQNIHIRVNLGGIHGGVDPTVLATVRRELGAVTVGAVQAALAQDPTVRRQIRGLMRG